MFKSSKMSFIIRGIAFTALAVLCFLSRNEMMETLAKIAGIVFVISGVVFFIMGYKSFSRDNESVRLSAALLMIIMGGIVIFRPDIVIAILGIFVIFEGVDFILSAITYNKAKAQGWWIMLVAGLAVVALGMWSILYTEQAAQAISATVSILIGCGFLGIGISCFVAVAGINALERYTEEKKKAMENQEEYVETEVVK